MLDGLGDMEDVQPHRRAQPQRRAVSKAAQRRALPTVNRAAGVEQQARREELAIQAAVRVLRTAGLITDTAAREAGAGVAEPSDAARRWRANAGSAARRWGRGIVPPGGENAGG